MDNKNIMTKENIEMLIISSILNKLDNFEILLSDITEDFFSNKNLRLSYLFLKENVFTKNEEDIELFFVKIGVSSENVKKIYNYKHNYTSESLKSFFIEVYKQRLINEEIPKIMKESISDDKFYKLKELNEKLKITSTQSSISNGKTCVNRYRLYLSEVQEAFSNNSGRIGISTGINSLDEKIIGIKNTEYMIIAARPSMGKTSLVTWFFIESIDNKDEEGVPVMFSLEMETEQIMGRMVAQMNDDLELAHTIFGKDSDSTTKTISNALEFFEHNEFYLEDFAGDGNRKLGVSPADLDRSLAEIEKKEGKIKVIIVDYIQLMSPSNPRIIDKNDRVTSISSELKSLGRKYGCPVIALSQLNRDLEKRQDKRPQLSDLRDSGSLEQDADIIMFVYRPEVYLEKELKDKLKSKPNDLGLQRQIDLITKRPFSEAELIIGKQRNGPTGIVNTYFHKQNARFGDIDEDLMDIDSLYGPSSLYEEED
jgi:replicative DNA helicase